MRNLILDSNNPIEMVLSWYWQAAKSTGEFTLVSCCVGPGFDFKDFELLKNTNHTSRLDKAINDLIWDNFLFIFLKWSSRFIRLLNQSIFNESKSCQNNWY